MFTSRGALRTAWEGIKNWKGKKYAVDSEGREVLNQEGEVAQSQEAVVGSGEQCTLPGDEGRCEREEGIGGCEDTGERGYQKAVSTLCPRIGTLQWSCTYDQCDCHLKESIKARKDVCIRCGMSDMKDCQFYYRHNADPVPLDCLLRK